jgi:hydroxymethylglutaryl-CoA synthase
MSATSAAATGWLNPPGKTPAGERAVCSWDEDSLTMGVAAAQRCLAHLPAGSAVHNLEFASTTLPFADRSNAGLMAAALALDDAMGTLDAGGSQRCATGALLRAFASPRSTLLVAAEKREARPGSSQDMDLGHGAVALFIDPAGGFVSLAGSASLARDFVDHHRESGEEFDYVLEERWVRDEAWSKFVPATLQAALRNAGVDAPAITHFICPSSAAVAARVAKACGLNANGIVAAPTARIGELGSTQPLFMLASALDGAPAGSLIALVGFGQGADALILRVEKPSPQPASIERLLGAGVPETNYLRYLSHQGLVDIDFGMRAERDQRSAQTAAYRRRDALTAFIGGRCTECGAVQFPRSRVCVNPQCRRTDTQQPHRLVNQGGRVKTFTEDWQAYSPRPPYIYGNVTFAEGGNLFMEFCDLEPGELAVDMPVQFQFRIKDIDRMRHFKRYFWKAAPAR